MSDYPLPNASNDLSGQVALVTGAILRVDDGQSAR
jgi:hypothetical protein